MVFKPRGPRVSAHTRTHKTKELADSQSKKIKEADIPKKVFKCSKCGEPLIYTIEVADGKFKIKQGPAGAKEQNKSGVVHCLACKEPALLIQLQFSPHFRILFTPVDEI